MKYKPITRLIHRDQRPKVVTDASSVIIEYGKSGRFMLPNKGWNVRNPFLQFLAVYGMQPTDCEEPTYEVDENKYIPLTLVDETWVPHVEEMMDGAQAALEEAEWFDPDVEIESGEEGNSGVFGGGSPDPGTGNQGAVDYESAVFGIDMNDGSLDVVAVSQ